MSDAGARGDLTVGQAAAHLGVTVRTLHHWEAVGVASASHRSGSGYRLYSPDDLDRLGRIVAYRELGVDLDTIRALLADSGSIVAALERQRAELTERIARLTELRMDVDRMIAAHRHGLQMSTEDQHAVFGDGWNPRWPAMAKDRWGESEQWARYAESASARTTADWERIQTAMTAFEERLCRVAAMGTATDDPKARTLVDEHREVFGAYFPITREMQVNLGRMYERDPRFAAHYDAILPGLAAWFRRAIDAVARSEGIDPESAGWT